MSERGPETAIEQLRHLARGQGVVSLREVRAPAELADAALAATERWLAHPETHRADAGDDLVPDLLDLATRMVWGRQHAATRALAALTRRVGSTTTPDDDSTWSLVCAGYETLTDLTELGLAGSGVSAQEISQAAAGLLAAADHRLEQADIARATLLASAALWLLFHQELHDAEPTSPLVTDTQAWLAPLAGSRVGRLLTGPARRRRDPSPAGPPTAPDADGGPARRHTPLVLTGAYPRFAAPVVAALRADPALHVRELPLSQVHKAFGRMTVQPWVIELRLRAGLGEPVHFPPLEEALSRPGDPPADTVLADWADAGAVIASLVTPPETTLTVRVHSVDALRCWLHLIDWSVVDQLICVGPHVQGLVREQLGDRLEGTRLRILPNIVHLARFDHPRQDDTDHTLAMVGWARAVKDPLWTVELLARLRAEDDRWRLLLIGHGWPTASAQTPGGAAYARRFAARTAEADVRGAIEFVPYTDDLPPVLARAGWVVSSSVRESWGVGPMEAVAAGAVPVIRDWPFFARWGGPRLLYPQEWVVDSVEEAQDRMTNVVTSGRRGEVAAASRALLAQLIDPQQAAADYRGALTDL